MKKTNKKQDGKDPNNPKKNDALRFIFGLLLLGILSILVFSIKSFWNISDGCQLDKSDTNFQEVVDTFSLAMLVAGSAAVIGCMMGFIFAIPKHIKTDNTPIKNGQDYMGNDNLVEVSDWLAKIIVGVGLTQLRAIPNYLMQLGTYIGGSIGQGRTGEVAAESIVVYFLICGFLISYVWTRLYFAGMLEEVDFEPETPRPVNITANIENANINTPAPTNAS